jgi:hypothetical protein
MLRKLCIFHEVDYCTPVMIRASLCCTKDPRPSFGRPGVGSANPGAEGLGGPAKGKNRLVGACDWVPRKHEGSQIPGTRISVQEAHPQLDVRWDFVPNPSRAMIPPGPGQFRVGAVDQSQNAGRARHRAPALSPKSAYPIAFGSVRVAPAISPPNAMLPGLPVNHVRP